MRLQMARRQVDDQPADAAVAHGGQRKVLNRMLDRSRPVARARPPHPKGEVMERPLEFLNDEAW